MQIGISPTEQAAEALLAGLRAQPEQPVRQWELSWSAPAPLRSKSVWERALPLVLMDRDPAQVTVDDKGRKVIDLNGIGAISG